jgi:hypothetical protein
MLVTVFLNLSTESKADARRQAQEAFDRESSELQEDVEHEDCWVANNIARLRSDLTTAATNVLSALRDVD